MAPAHVATQPILVGSLPLKNEAARHPECAIAAILCPLAVIHVIFRLLATSRRRRKTNTNTHARVSAGMRYLFGMRYLR